MTGIASSVGLISGIDYQSLVDQIMQVERAPVTLLENRTTALINQESAYTNLLAKFLTSSYMVNNLNKIDVFNRCAVTSSNTNVLTASRSGTATEGVYTFTPVQQAKSQETMTQGVASDTEALGKSGTITIGKGWSLENDVYLKDLNGGDGFTKGYIRVTDASGSRATIDLRHCVTMNDVIDAINTNNSADVWAELDGDKLVISDLSGGSDEVKVGEVAKGTTAASLGFTTENSTGADSVTGHSIYRLGESTSLNILNDGNGIVFDGVVADLTITCKDGSKITVDFNEMTTMTVDGESTTKNQREQTIGDLINTINNSEGNDGKIVAGISADGKSLKITDTTASKIRGTLVEGATEDDPDTYELPSEYDPADYELDEDGYLLYKTGAHAGQHVLDTSKTTKIIQTTNAANAPIMQSLGLLDAGISTLQGLEFSGESFTGRAIIGSLDSPLMASLNGGYGTSKATAGDVEIQDRAGNKATLSFSDAELRQMQNGTLNQATDLLNAKMASASWINADGDAIAYGDQVGVRIEMNDTKTGLNLVDKSGQSAYDLVFRDVESSYPQTDEDGDPVLDDEGDPVMVTVDPKIADAFGLNVGSVSRSTATGSSLDLQTVSFNTNLSDLNGGKGITLTKGKIVISDSSGATGSLEIDSKKHKTVGDIIDGINAISSLRVQARINDTGDGIELIDRAGGTGTFVVEDGSSSSVCKELGITGSLSSADLNEDGLRVISGRTTYSVEIEETDSLDDIRKKINDLGGNFSATIIADGSSTPYRLVIAGKTTGAAGAMNIDLSALGLKTETISEAQDALLVYGDNTQNSAVMLTSSSNTFKNVVNGISLTVLGTSTDPITVTSEKTSTDIKASITAFVENYNTFREQLNTDTYFSKELEQGKALHNDRTIKKFGEDIQKALLTPIYDIPGINSIQSLGISVRSSIDDDGITTETGKLVFDETVFDAAWETNPDGVQEFFCRQQEVFDESGKLDDDGNPKLTTIHVGWAQKFMDVAEAYTGSDGGKLYKQLETIGTKIDNNEERIAYLETRLETKKAQYLAKFYKMETAMAQMSSDMSTVSSIASNWSSNYSSSGSYS